MSEDKSDGYQKGEVVLKDLSPNFMAALENNFSDVAPALIEQIVDYAFGQVYARGIIDQKLRQSVIIACLATQSRPDQLGIHIQAGKDIGITREEMAEIIMQLGPYAGFPAVVSAMGQVKQIYGTDE